MKMVNEYMRRFLLLAPIFLILLTGCPDKKALDQMNPSDIEELDKCIEDKKAKQLPIAECSKHVEKSNSKASQETAPKISPTRNKKERNQMPKNKNKELDKIDACIADKQAKGLPSYECLQK